jgi:hypothetical protein
MLTIPATSLTIIPGLINVTKHRSLACMNSSDMKTSILSAVVVPILVLSSSTVTPSFPENIVSITSSDKVKPSTVSKEASDRSSLEILSSRVEKNENSIKDLMKGLDEIKSDLRGTIVLIVVVSILLLIRSEFNNNEMKEETKITKAETKEEMKRNKAETKEEMKINKAEADAKMDRNFTITTVISTLSLLISFAMTIATKK